MHYIQAMPTLQKFAACKVEIRFRDHLPPHVHVVTADRREALVEIESLKVTGNIPSRDLAVPLAWITDNKAFLLEQWRSIHG